MEPGFVELQQKVIKELNRDFQQGKMPLEDMMAAMYLLGLAKNEAELKEALQMFATDFRTLETILESSKAAEKESMDYDLQQILSQMIKNDPVNATEFAKLASKKDLTKADLIERFPQAKQYFE